MAQRLPKHTVKDRYRLGIYRYYITINLYSPTILTSIFAGKYYIENELNRSKGK
jgi:hypothetical protein